jgi:hypothetical protein
MFCCVTLHRYIAAILYMFRLDSSTLELLRQALKMPSEPNCLPIKQVNAKSCLDLVITHQELLESKN